MGDPKLTLFYTRKIQLLLGTPLGIEFQAFALLLHLLFQLVVRFMLFFLSVLLWVTRTFVGNFSIYLPCSYRG